MGPINDEKIIVKIRKLKWLTNEEEIRKVVLNAADEPMTLDELCLMCQRIFHLSANADLFFKYQDEDGDWISLVDNSDLVLALLDSKNYLKLQVSEESELDNSTSSKNSTISQSELRSIKQELTSIKSRIGSILNKLGAHEGHDTSKVGVDGCKRDPLASGVVEIPSTADKELTASLNSGVGKEFDPLHLSQSNFSSHLEKSQHSNTPPPLASATSAGQSGPKDHGAASTGLTGPPQEIGDNQVNDLSLSSNMSPPDAGNAPPPTGVSVQDAMGASPTPVMLGGTGTGSSLNNSSSSVKSGGVADRNTLSSSPHSSQHHLPPAVSSTSGGGGGGGFKPNVYNPQADDSNNLDAGGSSSTDRHNVPPSDVTNAPPSSMAPPNMEVNSLNKSMHPQPPPSMMHGPPMLGGGARQPFNPSPSNFMPPFMPGMPPPPSHQQPGRAGGTTPVNESPGGRPGSHFGPPPPPSSQSGAPNGPSPQPGYPQPPPTGMMGPPGASMPPPPSGGGMHQVPSFPTVSAGDSSSKGVPPAVTSFNGMPPPPPATSSANQSTSNMQQHQAVSTGPPPPMGGAMGGGVAPPPGGMMPPHMGGPPPPSAMQSMPPMNIPRGQMMYPGARYAMPSLPKGSSTPLQAPSSGDAPPSVSSSSSSGGPNPSSTPFNPAMSSYGSSPFMPPTNYPAPRGSSGMPPPLMSMPPSIGGAYPPHPQSGGPPPGHMMMRPPPTSAAPGPYGVTPGAPNVTGANSTIGGPPPMMMSTAMGPPLSFPPSMGPPPPAPLQH